MVAMPSPPVSTSWGYDRTWTVCYPAQSHYKTVYAEQFTALAKRLKREARAERDRQILRGVSSLHEMRARNEIESRRPFLRIAGKRRTERARRRQFA